MEKTLLQNFTGNSESVENAVAMKSEDEKMKLPELMKEMKPHLDEAAADLLHPRPEAVSKLLNKLLH